MKTCKHCQREQPATAFRKNTRSCITCTDSIRQYGYVRKLREDQRLAYFTAIFQRDVDAYLVEQGRKRCTKCDGVFSVSAFLKEPDNPFGLSSHCGACRKVYITRATENYRSGQSADSAKCSRCAQIKPASAFYRNQNKPGHLSDICRECAQAKQRSRYVEDLNYRELCKQKTREWTANNPEKKRAMDREYRATNWLSIRRMKRRYERQNRAKCRGWHRAYFMRHKERLLEKHREYNALFPERKKAAVKRWTIKNRMACASKEARRRARKSQCPGDHTGIQAQQRSAMFGGRCWVCGGIAQSMDHVKPIAAGGSNWPANLRPACTSCNAGKGKNWPISVNTAFIAGPVGYLL